VSMLRLILVMAAVLLVAGCGSTKSAVHTKGGAARLAGGCGRTLLHRGRPPAWTAPAFANSSPATPWPFAVSDRGTVVAIVFGYPLRAGEPTDPVNKILWIMRRPRHGSPLTVQARPFDAQLPVVGRTWPADSSPGEIYPSFVNVPKAGCWHLTLRWAHNTDSIDLRFKA
jgi:hypothetical protein